VSPASPHPPPPDLGDLIAETGRKPFDPPDPMAASALDALDRSQELTMDPLAEQQDQKFAIQARSPAFTRKAAPSPRDRLRWPQTQGKRTFVPPEIRKQAIAPQTQRLQPQQKKTAGQAYTPFAIIVDLAEDLGKATCRASGPWCSRPRRP